MSRFCGEQNTQPILEAAAYWRDNALLEGGSILTSKKLWTAESLELLDRYFVQNLDAGKDKFLQKLERQLAPIESTAKQLAAEMMWLMYLCPSSLTIGHKRQTIQTVWSWSGERFPADSRWLTNDVLVGVGSAGPGFNQNQWRELGYLIKFVRIFREKTDVEQRRIAFSDADFSELLAQVPEWDARQLRHMLLFLLFPDSHERIFGQIDRKAVVRHFSKRDRREVNRMNPGQLDDELQAIRKRLETENGTSELDFYSPPLRDEWKSETIAAISESITADHVRQALDELDREGVPSDAESTGYDLYHVGKQYPPKLVLSLAAKYATGEPLDRSTFSGGEESTAFRLLRRMGFEIRGKRSGDESLAGLFQRFLAQAAAGEQLSVQDYQTDYRTLKVKVSFGKGNFARIPWIAFLGKDQTVSRGIYPVFLLFREEKKLLLCYGVSEENLPTESWGNIGDAKTVKEWFRTNYGRNPERYGSSFVLATYDTDKPLPTEDMQRRLDQMIDAYAGIVGEQAEAGEPVSVREDLGEAVRAFSDALAASSVKFGEAHEALVSAFVASVATKPLVILTGLSGSGKTQIAIRFGEWLGGGRLHVAAVRPDWTGAEVLFGYEDGLRRAGDGQAAWSVPAPLEFMLAAHSDSHHPYLLVLDEMNLAHVERYFADALSGMESGQPCLPNLVKGNDGCWVVKPGGPERVPFPRNLWIVGTVNVDETTYMFSPKVLDRANTFEFRVSTADLELNSKKPSACTPGNPELVRGLLAISRNDDWHLHNPSSFLGELSEKLKQLHRILSRYGMEFGHRVFHEAIRFSSLAEDAGLEGLEATLDRIVMQKVLPRLHGSRRRLELPMLALIKYCRDLPASIEADEKFASISADDREIADARLPVSYSKAVRMLVSLRANQFVSFAE